MVDDDNDDDNYDVNKHTAALVIGTITITLLLLLYSCFPGPWGAPHCVRSSYATRREDGGGSGGGIQNMVATAADNVM